MDILTLSSQAQLAVLAGEVYPDPPHRSKTSVHTHPCHGNPAVGLSAAPVGRDCRSLKSGPTPQTEKVIRNTGKNRRNLM